MITTADQWSIVMGKGNKNQYNGSGQYNSNVNKYIKLGNNIDLSEVDPWEERTLTTCLDGDGYTLSGISQPLFSSVKGTVKNLVLSNVKIKEAKNFKHVGAIARTTAGTAIIENCYVEPAIEKYKPGDSFQFVRNGYFCIDTKDSTDDHFVFNRIVSLKSSFKLPKK